MRRSIWALSLVLALTLSTVVHAEAESIDYNTRVAKVTEIDHAKNTLVMQGEGGAIIELKVDPTKVKNFGQIKVGDMVKVQTTKAWAIDLTKKEKGEKPSFETVSETETAAPGSKPGAEKTSISKITAEVMKVDAAKALVELKGPRGNVVEFQVKDPSKLEGLKKGDMVSATYTTAIAISVEEAAK